MITARGFHAITSFITGLADRLCHGRYVLMPGSGYNPSVLPRCWYALVAGAMRLGPEGTEEPEKPPEEGEWVKKKVEEVIASIKEILEPFWKCFKV